MTTDKKPSQRALEMAREMLTVSYSKACQEYALYLKLPNFSYELSARGVEAPIRHDEKLIAADIAAIIDNGVRELVSTLRRSQTLLKAALEFIDDPDAELFYDGPDAPTDKEGYRMDTENVMDRAETALRNWRGR